MILVVAFNQSAKSTKQTCFSPTTTTLKVRSNILRRLKVEKQADTENHRGSRCATARLTKMTTKMRDLEIFILQKTETVNASTWQECTTVLLAEHGRQI